MLKAFTLMEVIVVMAIIAIITGLSVVGIVRYKATVELNYVYTEFVSGVKTQRNKANNSISYNPSGAESLTFIAPAFYSIRLANNSYDFYICNFVGSNNLISCGLDTSIKKSTIPSGIEINANCYGFGFRLINSDLVKIDDNSFITNGGFQSTPNPGTCDINLLNSQTGINKIINIDFVYDKLNF